MSIDIDLVNIIRFTSTLLLLLVAHFLADFPLQGDYMAKAKNPTQNKWEIWVPVMFGHCLIHAGFVYVITQQLSLAFLQFVTHWIIDVSKCRGRLSKDGAKAFLIDQLSHLYVLFIIAVLATDR